MFVLFNIILSVGAAVLDSIFGFGDDYSGVGIISILYSLVIILPSLGAESSTTRYWKKWLVDIHKPYTFNREYLANNFAGKGG